MSIAENSSARCISYSTRQMSQLRQSSNTKNLKLQIVKFGIICPLPRNEFSSSPGKAIRCTPLPPITGTDSQIRRELTGFDEVLCRR